MKINLFSVHLTPLGHFGGTFQFQTRFSKPFFFSLLLILWLHNLANGCFNLFSGKPGAFLKRQSHLKLGLINPEPGKATLVNISLKAAKVHKVKVEKGLMSKIQSFSGISGTFFY